MTWITITFETLKAYVVDAKLEALETAALGTDQASPFGEVSPGVISRIRAEIASCSKNVLDPDTTKIPESLKNQACALIVKAMHLRLKQALSEDQVTEAKEAIDYLKRIARCEVSIPDVTQEGAFQSTDGTPLLTPRRRNFSHRDQSGI